MSKRDGHDLRMPLREARKLFRRICECGQTFADHGAVKPHTIGDTCNGFVEKPRKRAKP